MYFLDNTISIAIRILRSLKAVKYFPSVWSHKKMSKKDLKAENYFCKDFSWDQLREEVESDPSIQFHVNPNSSKETADQNQDAKKNSEAWDKFHACHSSGKFFKERRYLLKEFPELGSCKDNAKVLEVGCGNGSTILPILCGQESIVVYASDCSNEALERVKEMVAAADSISAKHRFHPFQWDFSTTRFPPWLACSSCSEGLLQEHQLQFSGVIDSYNISIPNPSCYNEPRCCVGGVDFITLIFTLSALPPDRMPIAIAQCFAVLKPGGLLLFRDYGLYDMTMLRFKAEQQLGYRGYMRADGTRSYYFCLDTVRNLTSAVGFTEVELDYCCVKSVNRRTGKVMRRVWVHGKFQKPVPAHGFNST